MTSLRNVILLPLFVLLAHSAAIAQTTELTRTEKLALVREQFSGPNGNGFTIPCHELGVRYNQSFPAWTVGADRADGKMTPQQYRESKFLPISKQNYAPGKKHYILPVFYTDMKKLKAQHGEIAPGESELEGEFIGYLSFRVQKVEEPFHNQKHKYTRIEVNPMNGFNLVAPIRKTVKELDSTKVTNVGNNPQLGFKDVEKVFTEICGDPMYWSPEADYSDLVENEIKQYFDMGLLRSLVYPSPYVRNEQGELVSRFPGESYSYTKDDIPVALGYWMHYGDQQQKYINRLNAAETVVLLAGNFTPGVGTALAIKDAVDCKNSGEDGCWAKFADIAGSAVSDLGWFLKFNKVAQVLKTKLPRAAQNVDNALIYTGIGIQGGLAGVYAHQGDYLNAAGSVLSAGGNAYLLRFLDGKIKFVDLGEAKPQCSDAVQETVETAIVTSNAQEFRTCAAEPYMGDLGINLSSVQDTGVELTERLTKVVDDAHAVKMHLRHLLLNENRKSAFDANVAPIAVVDTDVQDLARGVPQLRIALDDAQSRIRAGLRGSKDATYFDYYTGTLHVHWRELPYLPIYQEVEIVREISYGKFLNQTVLTADRRGTYAFQPEIQEVLDDFILYNPQVFGELPDYVIRKPGVPNKDGIIRQMHRNIAQSYFDSGLVDEFQRDLLLNFLDSPTDVPSVVEFHKEIMDTIKYGLHVQALSYVGQRNAYADAVKFYQKNICDHPEMQTQFMEGLSAMSKYDRYRYDQRIYVDWKERFSSYAEFMLPFEHLLTASSDRLYLEMMQALQ